MRSVRCLSGSGWICLLAIFVSLVNNSCKEENQHHSVGVSIGYQDSLSSMLMQLNDNLTETVVEDGFSPPVASRIYAYPNIAFYETVRFLNRDLPTFAGKLNELENLPTPDTSFAIDYRVAAIQAFSKVAVDLVYRDVTILNKKSELQGMCFQDYKDSLIFNKSVAFGDSIAVAIIAWMSKDNYKETRTMPKYTVKYEPGKWIPTAPSFGEASEPHFMKVRCFVLDTCNEFSPGSSTPYSTDKNSRYYKEALEVYRASKILNDSLIQVARHWDCNPIPNTVIGHMKYVKRQLTPGGHWIWITGKVCRDNHVRLSSAAYIHALVAIGLMDAFISCWDEKYASEGVRPETYIKENIDKNWKPFLETPLFPEYSSGHSTISASANLILTRYFGPSVGFTDSAEVNFGLPPRRFESFSQAADEAMISRFLGGIHYMPACLHGKQQGLSVGNKVWQRLTVDTNIASVSGSPENRK